VKRLRVVGIGSEWRGDDAVGRTVARLLRDEGLDVLELDGEPASLVDALGDADGVGVVDAVRSGAAPGTVVRWDATEPLPQQPFRGSTHVLGLAEAVELARALGRLAPRVVVIGVEGGSFATGAGLSAAVAAAVRPAAAAVRAELAAIAGAP
jgi:hydrogenase maturation protease